MKRIFYSMALALCALMVSIPAKAARYGFCDAFDLKFALHNGYFYRGTQVIYVLDDDVLFLENDVEFDQENGNTDLIVVSAVNSHFTLDLNGHKLQRNISNPVGSDATCVISFKHVKATGTGRLYIFDSKGGGQIIANSSVMPISGNYLCAVRFPESCDGIGGELRVYGGDLKAHFNNTGAPNCYGIIDDYGQTVSIYGGCHDGYMSLNPEMTPTINLYGGSLGSAYNIGSGNYPALSITGKTPQGQWKGGTIFGAAYSGNVCATRVHSDSKIKLNGSTSSASAVDALSASDKKKAKIEIYEEFGFSVNGKDVTTLNAEDVLGDGKVQYVTPKEPTTISTRYLYLNSASLTSIETHVNLFIILSGENVLNGQLLGYGANVDLISATGHPTGASATDKLTVSYSAETPILLYDGNFKVDEAAGLSVNGKNNANAVDCKKFTLTNAWFDAVVTGTGPVVKCTSNSITSVLKSGSLTGKSVSYAPDIKWHNLYILGRQLNEWDVDTDITGEGISGKVHFLGGSIELNNAVIDARGLNVEAIKGQINYIIFKGSCFIISDSKDAIKLDGGSKTTFKSNSSGDNHLYIIGTYAINATGVGALQFGESDSFDPISIYSGSTAIWGNNNKPNVSVYCDMDISCANTGLPMYKVTPSIYSTRVSDFGGSVDADGVFTKADGKDADHVTFRRGITVSGTAYPIEVEGVTITSGNASDVLKDGKVSYNASTNTLTLNDANIEGFYTPGIRVTSGGLNIALVGSSAVQSSNPYGAIYSVNGDLNINGKQNDSLFVYGRGMMGLNRMTTNYRTAITGGCYVSAICRDDNFVKSYRSAAMQSDSLYVNKSTLYVENKSANPVNKVALYSYNANLEPGLLLVDAEIIKGEPNTPDPLLIAPTSGQAIDNIQVEGDQPQKIMMDGILYIVRDGKIYNALGAEVK